jgi:hypothetical protein
MAAIVKVKVGPMPASASRARCAVKLRHRDVIGCHAFRSLVVLTPRFRLDPVWAIDLVTPDGLRRRGAYPSLRKRSEEVVASSSSEGRPRDDRTELYRPCRVPAPTPVQRLPNLRHGSYFSDRLLERRHRAERALLTRRMEKLVETLDITRLSNWQVIP